MFGSINTSTKRRDEKRLEEKLHSCKGASDQSEPSVIIIHAEEKQICAQVRIFAGKLPVELLK